LHPAQLINENLLPYAHRLVSRPTDAIDLVVIHCTELPDLATAREYGQHIHYPDSGTGNSGHFYIERNGNVEQWVPLDRVAHHVRNYNERSIGIELVNTGRFPDWFDSRNQLMKEPYPAAQIKALISLLNRLAEDYSCLTKIIGHASLDTETVVASDQPARRVFRKLDPGPEFPWEEVLSSVSLEWFDPPHGI